MSVALNTTVCDRRILASKAIWGVLVVFVLFQGWRLEQLRRANVTETARGDLWKTVVDGIETGKVVVDAKSGEIVEWSAGASRLTGWSREDVLHQQIGYLMPTSTRLAHDVMLRDPDVVSKVAATPLTVDCWAVTKARKFVPLHVRVTATSTEPALFLVTLDNPQRLTHLAAEPQPKEDPHTLQTFNDKH